MGKDVIIACDFGSKKELLEFLAGFKGKKPFLKIGMELFYCEGPSVVEEAKKLGHKVFLDLKLHDIPNTVKGAVRSLSRLNADMLNVHVAGTKKMMLAAKDGFEENSSSLLIGVTQLTSTSEAQLKNELLIDHSMEEVVSEYAKLAKESHLDGVVCSPLEVARIKEVCGKDFITVTPGIRFEQEGCDDQMRIATPKAAREAGADYIVVGRPITGAKDPVAAYEKCCEEFLG